MLLLVAAGMRVHDVHGGGDPPRDGEAGENRQLPPRPPHRQVSSWISQPPRSRLAVGSL